MTDLNVESAVENLSEDTLSEDTAEISDNSTLVKSASAYAAQTPRKMQASNSLEKPKFEFFDNRRLEQMPHLQYLDETTRDGLRLAAHVFPFKVNRYVLDNLIDWKAGPDDPIYRLTFPHQDMLQPGDADELQFLIKNRASGEAINTVVTRIRNQMNPHPADQLSNVPIFSEQRMEGLQHKYKETVLFFPKQGQTCHSYCSFCFRWPQFVKDTTHKFESNDRDQLFSYLKGNRQVSDLLLTGGDPMIMNTRRLSTYLEPLLEPELAHIHTIRIGTKALTYWPYRFYQEPDSGELLTLISKLVDAGKHVAIMAHINHWGEIATEQFEMAVAALKRAGAVIRSQGPLLRHVNDDAEVWRRSWAQQVRLGIVPYYMFVERDTGAHHYFSLPLKEAHDIYTCAVSKLSGLGRTARGPVMSTGPGKVQVLGTVELNGEKFFILTLLQARNTEWLQKPFLAKYSQSATWLSELEPPTGEATFFFEKNTGHALTAEALINEALAS